MSHVISSCPERLAGAGEEEKGHGSCVDGCRIVTYRPTSDIGACCMQESQKDDLVIKSRYAVLCISCSS